MEKIKNKKILIFAALIVIIIAYNFFLKPKDSGVEQFVSSGINGEQLTDGKEIITLLEDLKSVNLNAEIFTSNAFISLQDFSIPIEPEPKGRVNPFSPVEWSIEDFSIE